MGRMGSSASTTINITKPGTVIDGQIIEGCVLIEADNVTIKNSRINCRSIRSKGQHYGAIDATFSGATGTQILNNTIICHGDGVSTHARCGAGIKGQNFVARYNNISGSITGIHATGPNVTAHKNYIHNLYQGYDPFGVNNLSRNSGIYSYGGANQTFTGNYLNGFSSTKVGVHGIFVNPETFFEGGNAYGVKIEDNYLGQTWTQGIKCRENPNNSFRVSCDIDNNRINKVDFDWDKAIQIETATPSTSNVSCNRWTTGAFISNTWVYQTTNVTAGC